MYPLRRLAHHRPRLFIAILIAVLTGFLLPSEWQFITRVLTAWNTGVWIYLLSISWLLARSNERKVHAIAIQEDNSAAAVLAILSIASVISIAAIVLELAASKQLTVQQRLGHFAFTGATVLGSWLLVGVLFTFHYARMFYLAPANARPLAFPNQEQHPDYWDFLYFSFTIAVAAQTSDVSVLSRSVRKVVIAQSVLSFLFNAAIIGLSINIAAGVVG